MTPKRSAGIREEEQHSRSLWYTDGRWMLDLDGGIKEDREEESLPAVAATVITRGEGPTVLEKWYLDLQYACTVYSTPLSILPVDIPLCMYENRGKPVAFSL